MIRRRALLVLALVCAAVAATAAAAPQAVLVGGGYGLSLADQQFQQAVDIRDSPDPTPRELKQAVKLLFAAAGIQHLSMERPQRGSGSDGSGSGSGSSSGSKGPEFLTASAVKLVLRNDTPPHVGALKELVYVYREGDGVPVNPAIAHRLLQLLAELGHPESQADVAFHLALGVEPVAPNSRDQLFRLVPPDVPAALLHYTFAAQAGDPVAQMSLGYRHMQGLGVPKSCQTAALYYDPVASRVLEMAQLQDGLPRVNMVKLSYRTAHAKRLSLEQESLHYQWFADLGNADAAREAARLLADAAPAGGRNYEQAIRYLNQAAAAEDSTAMAHLGHIYANGQGVPQDNATAVRWFKKAADHGHPSGMLALGHMHMTGSHGLPKDYGTARRYLQEAVASGQAIGGGSRQWSGLGDAYFYLGQMHLRGWGTKPDKAQAIKLWELAARLTDPKATFDAASSPSNGALLAAYNLAQLHLGGHAGQQNGCPTAVALLKRVAEKGFPAQQEANEDFSAGDYEWALLNYLKAAEMGVALGQANAAWMLTEGYGYEGPEAGAVALLLYKRAAQQGDHAALLSIGDSYWYGKGVRRDWRRAAKMYSEASNHRSAQALFNLGFMHQFGAGLPKDHHLAKRFYDSALKAQPRDAGYAVQLALLFLRLHGWWDGVQSKVPESLAASINAVLLAMQGRGTTEAAAPAERHYSLTGQHGVWARARRLATLDFWFDRLDEIFEAGDNVDLTVAAGLLLMLALVLWRRRMVRAQNQARQFVQAQAGPAPVPDWVPRPAQPPAPAAAAPAALPAAAAAAAGVAPAGPATAATAVPAADAAEQPSGSGHTAASTSRAAEAAGSSQAAQERQRHADGEAATA